MEPKLSQKGACQDIRIHDEQGRRTTGCTLEYYGGTIVGSIGSGANHLSLHTLDRDLYAAPPDLLAKVRVLAKAIEEVSQTDPGVGPATLVVILMPPWYEGSGVAYYTPNYKTVEDSPLGLEPPVLYSPWILSQQCTWAPSQMWGNVIPLPGWPLQIPLNPPEYDGLFVSLTVPQLRRPPP